MQCSSLLRGRERGSTSISLCAHPLGEEEWVELDWVQGTARQCSHAHGSWDWARARDSAHMRVDVRSKWNPPGLLGNTSSRK